VERGGALLAVEFQGEMPYLENAAGDPEAAEAETDRASPSRMAYDTGVKWYAFLGECMDWVSVTDTRSRHGDALLVCCITPEGVSFPAPPATTQIDNFDSKFQWSRLDGWSDSVDGMWYPLCGVETVAIRSHSSCP
jgi:hypothetical protein